RTVRATAAAVAAGRFEAARHHHLLAEFRLPALSQSARTAQTRGRRSLAEAALAVTVPAINTDYRWIRANRHTLKVGAPVEINPQQSRDALELMCVGQVIKNTEMLIADDAHHALPNGQVGHILIRGASVSTGYFADAEATK